MTVMSNAAFHLFDTDFGVCGIAWTPAGLSRVQLPEGDVAATEARLRRIAATRQSPDESSLARDAVAGPA